MQKIIFIGIFFFISAALVGQNKRAEIEDKIESRRIAFITETINLSSNEAQKFWPLYNDYKSSLKSLRKTYKAGDESGQDKSDQNLESLFEYESRQLELKKEYANKVESILGTERTLMLLQAERKFKENLLRTLKQNRLRNKRGF